MTILDGIPVTSFSVLLQEPMDMVKSYQGDIPYLLNEGKEVDNNEILYIEGKLAHKNERLALLSCLSN
jgi:hypothetical protein